MPRPAWRTPSPTLGHFAPFKRPAHLATLPAREFKVPSDFSLSRNPEGCIRFFRKLVEYARSARCPRITLDHRNVTNLGLGADSLLGVLLREIRQELSWVPKAYIRGLKPKDAHIRRIMDEVGSVRTLFGDNEEDVLISTSSSARVFRYRNSRVVPPKDPFVPGPASRATAAFVDHLERCVSLRNKQLTESGRLRLCEYIGEILDNATEHAGTHDWLAAGYIDPRDANLTYRAVILSLGRDFAGSFQALPKDSYGWQSVEPYLLAHRRSALFGGAWSEEDLLTVVALQGDISSKNQGEDTDRGQGTVDLISFFQGVSVELAIRELPAQMHLLSGATQIVFDGRYSMSFVPDLNRWIIAFNDLNDLFQKPDPRAVTHRGEHFPGVVVSICLPLGAVKAEPLIEEKT